MTRSRSLPIALALTLLLASCGAPTPGPGGPDLPVPDLAQVDTRAADLAARFGTGQPSSAQLQEVLAASGIAVRGLDGRVIQPAQQPAQGVAVADLDPDALAFAQARGGTVTLADLADTLRVLYPNADASRIAELLREDLRLETDSVQPTTRFWARFVTASGPAGQPGLLSDAPADQVPLSAVQHTLIMLRLVGGSARQAQMYGAVLPTPATLPAGAGVHAQGLAPTATANCTFGGTEGTIMDAAALAMTSGLNQLLAYLDSVSGTPGESAADRAAGWLGTANLITSYTKFLLTFASFQMDLTVDNPTVQRTRSATRNGEGVHQASVRVHYDLNTGVQYLNCFRLAFNAAGIDFSTPNAGAVEGSDVRWRVFAAQGQDSYTQRHTNILSALQGEEVMHDKTGADGVADLRFEGVRQKRDLGDDVTPVLKEGSVTAITSIKSSSLAADLVDALGTAAGGVGGLITMPQELLYRMWPISATAPLTVRDWKLHCEGQAGDTCWIGTVKVLDQGRMSVPVYGTVTGGVVGSQDSVLIRDAVYTVNGHESSSATFARLTTQAEYKGQHDYSSTYNETFDVECIGFTRSQTMRSDSTAVTNVEKIGTSDIDIEFTPGAGYTLEIGDPRSLKLVSGMQKTTSYSLQKGGCNDYHDSEYSTSDEHKAQLGWFAVQETGTAVEEDGVTHLTGGRSFILPGNAYGLEPVQRTIEWDLTRIVAD